MTQQPLVNQRYFFCLDFYSICTQKFEEDGFGGLRNSKVKVMKETLYCDRPIHHTAKPRGSNERCLLTSNFDVKK